MVATPDPYAAGAPFRSSHGLWCGEDDFLRISVLGIGTQVVVVTGRVLSPAGEPLVFSHPLASPASRTVPATLIRAVGCGWLENVTAICASAGTGLQQTFVTVDLVRGPSAGGGVLATLLQGPLASLQRMSWPGSPMVNTLDGPGVIRSIAGTDPAANVEISETVPAGARWRLLNLVATLVTDANAANREVSLTFDDGTTVYAVAPSSVNQAASLTRRYSAGAGSIRGAAATALEITIAITPVVLLAGHRIATVTTNRQVTDNWGAPQYTVEEWLEGA